MLACPDARNAPQVILALFISLPWALGTALASTATSRTQELSRINKLAVVKATYPAEVARLGQEHGVLSG
jgi:hypothetical protein